MSPFFLKFLIYGGIALAISAGATAAVVTYKSAIVRAERAENDLRNAKAELAAAETARIAIEAEKQRLQALFDEADRLAKEAAAREEQERNRNAVIAKALADLAKQDPKVREWATSPVPESVRRLRRDPGADNQDGVRRAPSVPDPNRPPEANPRTTDLRRDEWRFGSREPGQIVRPAFLQFGQSGHPETDREESETMKTSAMLLAAIIVATAAEAQQTATSAVPVQIKSETNFYDAMSDIASSADPETKRLAIFAATIARIQDKSVSVAAPAQQVIVPRAGRSFWDVVVDVGDRVFSGVERVAPAALAYAGQRHQTKASVQMAEINSAVAIEQGRNFVAVAQGGFNATQQTAVAGFNAITQLPTATSYSVNGNANFGPGNFAVTTNTNSGNTTRTCTSGTAGNSGGATGGPGGTSGSPTC